ncbi:MAG: DUF3301 domain-containing protein [Parasulfuritortus sp.]|jgi:hypothetical protein|nr:DUF3301 domain-containing protein [Parasulfuritortus sp.]
MNWELVLTAVLVLAGWFWWDGLNKRELAIRAARLLSQKAGVQLLDETVSLKRLGLARDDNQQVRIQRQFGFEYSDTGDNRLPGYVYLLGDRVVDANLVIPAAKEV